MKKSTEESVSSQPKTTQASGAKAQGEDSLGFWTEVFFTEGGISILFIFPLTVLYFLLRAIG